MLNMSEESEGEVETEEGRRKGVGVGAEGPPSSDPPSKQTGTEPSEGSPAPAKPKSWTAWDNHATNAFFDTLKIHGKDFKLVTQWMSAKGARKTYQQVRSFYHNKLKEAQAVLKLNQEGWLDNVPREAKDLFLLINYGEWRRRGLGFKGNQLDKFRELVLKGSTTVKLRPGQGPGAKNQRVKIIRTQKDCPALKKFCESPNGERERIPAKVVLELVPQTGRDKAYVMECEQSPFLRLLLSSNKPLKPYLAFLANKWLTPTARKKAAALEQEASVAEVTLFPHPSTTLSSAKIRIDPTPSASALSLERCSQLLMQKDSTQTTPPKEEGEGMGGEKEIGGESASETLYPQTLRDGISLHNVGTMTAGQLSLMCNLAEKIQLTYSIKVAENEEGGGPEAWKCLMTLLRREYGDALLRASEAEGPGRGPATPKSSLVETSIPPGAVPPPKVTPRRKRKDTGVGKKWSGMGAKGVTDAGFSGMRSGSEAFRMQLKQLNPKLSVVVRQQIPSQPQTSIPVTTQNQNCVKETARIQESHQQPMEIPVSNPSIRPLLPSQEQVPGQGVIRAPTERGLASPPSAHSPQLDFSNLHAPHPPGSAPHIPTTLPSHPLHQLERGEVMDESPLRNLNILAMASTSSSSHHHPSTGYIERMLGEETNDMDKYLGQLEANEDGTLITPQKIPKC